MRLSEKGKKLRRRLDSFGALVMAAGLVMALVLRCPPQDIITSPHARILKGTKHSHFEQALTEDDFSEYSCDNLYQHELNHDERCAYAQTCNDGDGIFAPIIYCSTRYSTRFLSLVLGIPLIMFLIILFRILGSTAEEFFSPGLEMMSLEMGLPERFAGVTLLALGNGAPDVASTVNAILNDRKYGYKMALGELTGSGMVASTVIVGAVTFVAHGVSCRGALVRDVVMFIATMIVVYLSFHAGTISKREIHGFVALYLVYVCVVLAADVYHRHVFLPRKKLARQLSAEEEGEVVEQETTALLSDQASRDRRSYSVSDMEEPVKQSSSIFRRYKSAGSDGTATSKPIGNLERIIEAFSNYDEGDDGDAELSVRSENGEIEQDSDRGWGHTEVNGTEPLMVFHPHHGGMVDLKHTERMETTHEKQLEATEIEMLVKPAASRAPQSWSEAFATAWPELADYFSKFWRETYYNDEYNMVDKFLMTCELLFMIARMVSTCSKLVVKILWGESF